MVLQLFNNSNPTTPAPIDLLTTDDAVILQGVTRQNATGGSPGSGLVGAGNQHFVDLQGSLLGGTNGMLFTLPGAPDDHLIEISIAATGYLAAYGQVGSAIRMTVGENDIAVSSHMISNHGQIWSRDNGIVIDTSASFAEVVTIVNTGLIEASDIVLGFSGSGNIRANVVNSGVLRTEEANFAIRSTSGAGSEIDVRNSGLIVGSVVLSNGNDTFDNRGGTVTGLIDLGGGDNIFTPGTSAENVQGGFGSGIDTMNLIFASTGLTFDLINIVQSNSPLIAGDIYNGFEGVIGSRFADTLFGSFDDDEMSGSDGNDVIDGRAGADRIDGGQGNDTLRGGDGNDVFVGGDGVDAAFGGNGDDIFFGNSAGEVFRGEAGNDRFVDLEAGTVDGGIGVDTVEFDGFVEPVFSLALDNSFARQGSASTATFTSIENIEVQASVNVVKLSGNALANLLRVENAFIGSTNQLFGRDGNDTFHIQFAASATKLTIDGGNGVDTLSLGNALNLTISLDNSLAVSGFGIGAGSTFISVENVAFDMGANVLKGSAVDNVFLDAIITDVTGDSFNGLGGSDTVSYQRTSTFGVIVDLDTTAGSLGNAVGDTFVSIENLIGTNLGDTLGGNAGRNILRGLGGADALFGEADNDTLIGGGDGDDLFGGAGSDTAAFASTVKVFMLNMDANTGEAFTDTFNSIENLTGSAGNDQLEGDNVATGNELFGAGGADILKGHGGNDTLRGGTGADIMFGGAGVDRFQFLALNEAGDRVDDFDVTDFVVVENAVFTGLIAGATVNATQFIVRADNNAQDANDRFIFRTSDDSLWYDSNGNAAGGTKIMVADLNIVFNLAAGDILQV